MERVPRIQRVSEVVGKSIRLRAVQEQDAEFLLTLRTNPKKNRHLSPVPNDVPAQRAWIREYLASDSQAYFLICDSQDSPVGSIRIYDPQGQSFSWGSWVVADGAPISAAIEAALLVYLLATERWGFTHAHFKVHKSNISVLHFHEKFGAVRTAESIDEIWLSIGLEQIRQSLHRYARLLPKHVAII